MFFFCLRNHFGYRPSKSVKRVRLFEINLGITLKCDIYVNSYVQELYNGGSQQFSIGLKRGSYMDWLDTHFTLVLELALIAFHHINTSPKWNDRPILYVPSTIMSEQGVYIANSILGQIQHMCDRRTEFTNAPEIYAQQQFSQRNSWKFSEETVSAQRLFPVTQGTLPEKEKKLYL